MQRKDNSKELLQTLYHELNETLEKKMPALNLDDPEALRGLLESMYQREGMASRQKAKYKHKKSSQLRSAIADLLLLYDGKDYQKKIISAEDTTNSSKTDGEKKDGVVTESAEA